MEGITTWLPKNEDVTWGIQVYKKAANCQELLDMKGHWIINKEATSTTRLALESFLVCLGTYCPDNFMHTVVQESTSYNWVMVKMKMIFKLETKGLGFLTGEDIKIDFTEEVQALSQSGKSLRILVLLS